MAKTSGGGLAERIRAAIQGSGQSLSELGRAAGLDHGRLSRFVRGERDLTLEAADSLCEVLGLALHPAEGQPAVSPPGRPSRADEEAAVGRGRPRKAEGSKPASKGRRKKAE